jgi:hypothetical protein
MEIKFLLVLALAVAVGVVGTVQQVKSQLKFPEPLFLPVMELNRVEVLEKALDQLTVQVSDLVKDLARLKAQHLESEKEPE